MSISSVNYGANDSAYLSPFGGFWTDKTDSLDAAKRMLDRGEIKQHEYESLVHFILKGYAVIKGVVSDQLIQAFSSDLEKVYSGEMPRQMSYWGKDGHHLAPCAREHMMENEAKLLDFHWPSEAAHDLIFAPAVKRFLELVFQDKALAFQSLYFQRGSEQGIHQDTAFVPVANAPLEFVATWIALEDVKEGAGELLYVPASHRMPDLTYTDGNKKCPPHDPLLPKYTEMVRNGYEKAGLKPEPFLPKKGDVLFWAADLAHGGSAIKIPGATRRSMVTHYCPLNRRPEYFQPKVHEEPRVTRSGGWVVTRT